MLKPKWIILTLVFLAVGGFWRLLKGIDQIPLRVFNWQKDELKGTNLYSR